MDALEARLQFIQVLKSLPKTLNTSRHRSTNTTTTSPSSATTKPTAQDPIQFYLQHYKQHHEDFQQCLLDTMGKMDPLDRLYIMIYYTQLLSELHIQQTIHPDDETLTTVLVKGFIPNLHILFEMVVPSGNIKALTNLPYCIQTCQDLKQFTGISEEMAVVQNHIDQIVQFRNMLYAKYSTDLILESTQSDIDQSDNDKTNTQIQIALNRMEMDRDRHKREKEQNWVVERISATIQSTSSEVVPNSMLGCNEFQTLWNSIDGFNNKDHQSLKDLQEIAKQSYLS